MRIAISEAEISKYPNEEARLAAYRERRARLFPKPICVPITTAQIEPTLAPIKLDIPQPYEPTALAIVELVAARLGLDLQTALTDATSTAAQVTRKISAGILVRRLELKTKDVATALNIVPGAVIDGLVIVDTALRDCAIPRNAPIDQMLTMIFDNAPAELSSPRANLEEIKRVVAAYFNVSIADLLSQRRTANIVRPRQIAITLIKHLTLRSLPEIGRRFGGRDHTTILHAVRKFKPAMEIVTAQIAPNAPIIDWVKALDKAHPARGRD